MTEFNDTYVVIVEDDTYSTDVLANMLDLLSVNYTALPEGSQIMNAMQSLPKVDAIFLDLELPKQDGFKILKAIQLDPQWKDVPVIAYTSHTSQMTRAREAGFHSFLGKPLRAPEFANQFARILNNQAIWE